MKNRKQKKLIIILGIVLGLIAIFIAASAVYISDSYAPKEEALHTIESPAEGIRVIRENDALVFLPENPVAGMIFYPGGKVQCESYAPLMEKCAQQGILCVLVHVNGNLAFLEMNAADGWQEKYPEIQDWYLCGHSLGGVAASAYLEKNAAQYKGLILLGSYSTKDFSDSDLKVLTIVGSEDNVVNWESREKAMANLPASTEKMIIPGGCHAYFGNYGEQSGDGSASISAEEQQQITSDAIASFIR